MLRYRHDGQKNMEFQETLGWEVVIYIDDKAHSTTFFNGKKRYEEASLLADKISFRYYNRDCDWMVKVYRITESARELSDTLWNHETHKKYAEAKYQAAKQQGRKIL